jgi:nucleosome binding factor SPN SPT16 subunit
MRINRRFNNMPAAVGRPIKINSPQKARELIMQKNAGKTLIGTPIFPGTQGGLSIEQVREFIQNQKRVTGVSFTTAVGTTAVNIELPGDARLLLGIAFENPQSGDTFDLSINNGGVIDNGSVPLHSINVLTAGVNYITYNFPLSSKTSIDLAYLGTGAIEQHIDIFYI